MNKNGVASVMTRKFFLLSALFFIATLYSCKKDGELSPDFDTSGIAVEFMDTLSIETTLAEEDSVQSDVFNFYLLGLYHDPIFGVKSSSIYTNVNLTGSTNFGSGFSIDSVVLTLAYAGLYGDTNSSMSINVYELSSILDDNNEYYSNDSAAYDPTLLKSITFTPNLTDSVLTTIDSVMHKPHLRIRLDEPNLISKLEGDTIYNTNADLNNVFKGLHITTTNTVTNNSLLPEEGSIVYFDMHSSLSTVTVYYNDTLQQSFLIDADTKKFNRFAQNFAGTDVEKHLTNSILKDSTVSYVSSMAGVKTKLNVPHLKTLLKDGDVIINKAELVVPVAINTIGNFDYVMPTIRLIETNSTGAVFLINNSDLNTSTNTYSIDVSRYIHRLLYETPSDYEMYLVSPSVSANRLVLGTSSNPFSPLKLNITYSKLN